MTYKPVDTAIVMVVGPCIDDTDFKTLEEAIAYNAAGMDISLIVEKTDGTTAVTAITLTTAGTSDWTHKDGGYYEVEVTAAQNAEEGIAYLRGVCTGVLPFESQHYNIVKANVYNSLISGTDVLTVDVTQWLGTAVTANIAGQPTVDVTRVGASTQSLIDLKDFVDSGYDPVTNKVEGVKLVDTVTTATNLTNAPTNGDLTATMKTSIETEMSDALKTDTIPDSYSADGSQPTIAQAVLEILQMMQEKSISGTTLTVKKPDGSTSAMTFTLDSATAPTSITRAT